RLTDPRARSRLYPAPTGRPSASASLGHSLRTTTYPPTKLPAATTIPSPAAHPLRNARSCPILECGGLPPLFPPTKLSSLLHQKHRSLRSALLCDFCASALTINLFPYFRTSLLPTSSAVPEQNHIPLLNDVFF